MDRWARLRRALVWTPVAGALLVQGLLLVRFASDGMTAFLVEPDTFRGRWWHPNEPLLAYGGYLLVVVAAFLLGRVWTRALRTPHAVRRGERSAEGEEGDEGEEVAIEMPAFLRPKTRRTRPGAAALAAWTAAGVTVLAGGAGLGVVETVQLATATQTNQGDVALLTRNGTVWILRLMRYFAPALLAVGAAGVAAAWAAYWPLPPAREVVVGQKQRSVAGSEWHTVE